MLLSGCGAATNDVDSAATTPHPTQAWADYLASLDSDDVGPYRLLGGGMTLTLLLQDGSGQRTQVASTTGDADSTMRPPAGGIILESAGANLVIHS